MKNKGQITVFFSLMISVLLLFTLTALEVGRIYMSRVKERAVVHSARTGIMADYHRELFERYHLLFLDVTYGTGSEAVVEERIKDYIEESLNGGSVQMYQYNVEEIALSDGESVLDNDMKQLKEQIKQYEKTAGVMRKAQSIWEKFTDAKSDMKSAEQETEHNGQEIPGMEAQEGTETANGEKNEEGKETANGEKDEEVSDPRTTLKEMLQNGILTCVLPDNVVVSKEKRDYSNAPSSQYSSWETGEKTQDFSDILNFKNSLKEVTDWYAFSPVEEYVFADYVNAHFSNIVQQRTDCVMPVETEYIIAGKDNDYDNMESVIRQITRIRMPVNYACLLKDTVKKSEALTLAAGICTATGTPALMEIVKYLLLGCWAYGESLHEVKLVLAGECVPYIKTSANWYTDLESLTVTGEVPALSKGMDYGDFLMLLIIKRAGKEITYARMLDVIEKNLQVNMPGFQIKNLIGKGEIQGKITVNPMFATKGEGDVYEYYFEETFSYTQ